MIFSSAETTTIVLRDGENRIIVASFVSTQYQRVTEDRRTRPWHIQRRHSLQPCRRAVKTCQRVHGNQICSIFNLNSFAPKTASSRLPRSRSSQVRPDTVLGPISHRGARLIATYSGEGVYGIQSTAWIAVDVLMFTDSDDCQLQRNCAK